MYKADCISESFGLRGNPPSGGVVTGSWKEDNVLILASTLPVVELQTAGLVQISALL